MNRSFDSRRHVNGILECSLLICRQRFAKDPSPYRTQRRVCLLILLSVMTGLHGPQAEHSACVDNGKTDTVAPGICVQTPPTASQELSLKDRLEVFEKVWNDINDYYYDPSFKGINWKSMHEYYLPLVQSVKAESEFYALLNKMTGELHDAHTRVLSPRLRTNLRQQQRVTAGFRVAEIEGRPVITEVTPGSEAARAGIEPGMIVLTINDQPAADRLADMRNKISPSSSERLDQIRVYASVFGGDYQGSGTSLKLGLQRANGSSFDTTVTRQAVSQPPQVTAKRLPSGYAYIAFDQFTPELSKQFKNSLVQLRDSPGLIIDIRVNSGGSNQGLYPIVENFFNSKKLFLRNTTRTGKPFPDLPLEMYLGHEGGQVYSGPVVILTSALSGSTAEMFAAGMQESGRAKIVGTESCGCVVGINTQRELKGGGVLQISEVLWLTPNRRKLEGEGVIPDKTVMVKISDLQQHRDPVLEQAEEVLRQMPSGVRTGQPTAGSLIPAHFVDQKGGSALLDVAGSEDLEAGVGAEGALMRAAASTQPFARFSFISARFMFRSVRYRMILIVLLVSVTHGLGPGVSTASRSSGCSQTAAHASVDSAPILSDGVRQTTLKTVNGKSLKLSDFSNKVVVINIWATWCGPCLLEMPRLSKMNREYKSRGVVFLGLATTYNENYNVKRVKHYLRVQKINYKSIWDDGTLIRPLVEAVHGRSVIPQSFVISKDGRIVKHFEGFNPASSPDLLRAAVEQALKGNAN